MLCVSSVHYNSMETVALDNEELWVSFWTGVVAAFDTCFIGCMYEMF